jgi:hypothetical protein
MFLFMKEKNGQAPGEAHAYTERDRIEVEQKKPICGMT